MTRNHPSRSQNRDSQRPPRSDELPPHGQVVVSEDGRYLCCHVCGGWSRQLGNHVRTHGLSAADYREAYGLNRGQPLVPPDLSQRYAARTEHLTQARAASGWTASAEIAKRAAQAQAPLREQARAKRRGERPPEWRANIAAGVQAWWDERRGGE